MKNLKLLGLAAATAMALMAFAASSASATALYNGATKLGVGSELDFSLKSGTSASLVETGGETLVSYSASTWRIQISNAGGSTSTVTGDNLEITDTSGSVPIVIVTRGKSEIHWTEGTGGTVTADTETGMTLNTVFFGSCVYGYSAGTKLGTLTTASSGAATFNGNAVAKKLSGSSFACPETAKWTATYVSTTPVNLRVEAS